MPPKKQIDDIDKYKTKSRVGAYNPEEYTEPRRKYEFSDSNNNNPWIEFAKQYALEHNMTLGCAVRNRECRLEYNRRYKIKKSITNVPPQLQDWVKHSKAAAKQENNCMSCQFTNKLNQKRYKEGDIAVEARKTPAKSLSVADLEQKLERLISEYKDVASGRVSGNLKSIDANIIRTRILLDERENEYLSNPVEEDDEDEYEGRYQNIGIKEKKKPKHHRTPEQLEDIQEELRIKEDELKTTVDALKNKDYNFSPKKLQRIKDHAKELRKSITQLKNILYANYIMKRKPRQKKGGAIGETARLGHPGSIQDSPLRSSSQIPTPPRGYNDAFVSDISTEPKRRGKLNGYGRISDRRNMSMFKNDACVIPM
jgi:hypothetical protein